MIQKLNTIFTVLLHSMSTLALPQQHIEKHYITTFSSYGLAFIPKTIITHVESTYIIELEDYIVICSWLSIDGMGKTWCAADGECVELKWVPLEL